MALQFDLFGGEYRLTAIPVVFQDHIVHNQLAIEMNSHTLTYHLDVERVPLAYGIVRNHVGLARILLIVVQAARTDLPVGRVPDLNLGCASQVDAAVAI